MRTQLCTYLLGASLLFGSGCLPDSQVKIYPTEGSDNVPVNAMITIYIKASANVARDDIKKEFFSMVTCPAPKTEKPANDDGKDTPEDKDDQDVQSSPIGASSTRVDFYYQVVEFDQAEQAGDATTGGTGWLVYLIPEPNKNASKPLQDKATRYCVSSQAFKNNTKKKGVKKQTIEGATASFTTEEVSGFPYSDSIDVAVEQEQVAAKSDFIVLHFPDKAINPVSLKASTTLCQQDDKTQDTQGPCAYYGKKTGFTMAMVENLRREDDQDINTYSSNLFTMTPTKIDPGASQYQVVIDASLGASSNPDENSITKTIAIKGEPIGRKILTKITGENSDSYYEFFGMGVKTK